MGSTIHKSIQPFSYNPKKYIVSNDLGRKGVYDSQKRILILPCIYDSIKLNKRWIENIDDDTIKHITVFNYGEKHVLNLSYYIYNKQLEKIQKTNVKGPMNFSNYNKLGVAYNEIGAYDKAIAAFQKANSINPNDASTYYNMGISYENKNQINKAIYVYQKSILINPKYKSSYTNLGLLYENKGLYDKAIFVYQKALLIDPNDTLFYLNIGNSYYGKQIKVYQKAARIGSKGCQDWLKENDETW